MFSTSDSEDRLLQQLNRLSVKQLGGSILIIRRRISLPTDARLSTLLAFRPSMRHTRGTPKGEEAEGASKKPMQIGSFSTQLHTVLNHPLRVMTEQGKSLLNCESHRTCSLLS